MATATKKKPKAEKPGQSWCKCFDAVNRSLEQHNAALDLKMLFNFTTCEEAGFTMKVPLVKLDSSKRKPLPSVLMKFCPFCGKYLKSK